MNKINFQQSVGFPLETDILNEMQNSWSIFNFLGNIVSSNAIISGCEIVGSTVTNGVVFVNNEILEFRGGNIQSTVVIKQDITSREFEDGNSNEVIYTRYVTFGSATANQFNFSDFVRAKSTHQLTQDKAEQSLINTLISRIESLEARPISNVPIGMIAIWNRPFNEIPEGWQEVTELRGRTPIGLDPDYDTNMNGDNSNYNLNLLNYQGGVREHSLTIEEMPEHNHNYSSYNPIGSDGNRFGGNSEFQAAYSSNRTTGSVGNSSKHTNMSPYRVVYYIKYTG